MPETQAVTIAEAKGRPQEAPPVHSAAVRRNGSVDRSLVRFPQVLSKV